MAQRIIDDDKLRSYFHNHIVYGGPWDGKEIRLTKSFHSSLIMTVNGQRGFYQKSSEKGITWQKL